MVTGVEQKQETEETEVVETPAQLIKKGLSEKKSSKETETVSKKETKETEVKEKEVGEEPITFKTQAELDKHVDEIAKRLAQGMKDKELKPVYDEMQKHKRDKELLELRLSDKAEDTKLSKLEKAELEEHGDIVEVRDTQEVRREAIKLGRANRDKSKELEATASQLQEIQKLQDAFVLTDKFFLPEDEEYLSKREAFAKKLASAETQKERELILENEELKMHTEVEPKPRKPRPDSSLPSAPGGADFNKMSGRELIKYHVAHKKK